MDKLSLQKTLIELTERLDMYFHGKLRQEPRARADLEYNKEELLQSLCTYVLANYNREEYRNYSPERFIWIKAENIWIDFTRRLTRQSKRNSNTSIDELAETYVSIDFITKYENQDIINLIQSSLTQKEVELLHYKAHGYTNEQIKKVTNYPSANAVKTSFYRLKQRIQILFRKP